MQSVAAIRSGSSWDAASRALKTRQQPAIGFDAAVLCGAPGVTSTHMFGLCSGSYGVGTRRWEISVGVGLVDLMGLAIAVERIILGELDAGSASIAQPVRVQCNRWWDQVFASIPDQHLPQSKAIWRLPSRARLNPASMEHLRQQGTSPQLEAASSLAAVFSRQCLLR